MTKTVFEISPDTWERKPIARYTLAGDKVTAEYLRPGAKRSYEPILLGMDAYTIADGAKFWAAIDFIGANSSLTYVETSE